MRKETKIKTEHKCTHLTNIYRTLVTDQGPARGCKGILLWASISPRGKWQLANKDKSNISERHAGVNYSSPEKETQTSEPGSPSSWRVERPRVGAWVGIGGGTASPEPGTVPWTKGVRVFEKLRRNSHKFKARQSPHRWTASHRLFTCSFWNFLKILEKIYWISQRINTLKKLYTSCSGPHF